jgi:protein-S-isoprenylcysteine O-methyltransferase Ste14
MSRARSAWTLSIPAILMLIAMLIGWGLDDVTGFFSNAARRGLIITVFAMLAAGIAWRIELNPFRKGTRHGRGWPIVAGILTAPLIWVLAAYGDRRALFVFPESAVLRSIGVAAFAAGECIRLAALRALGRQYSAFLTVQEGHQLIRTGIYRRIRHPFYLGGLLNAPGVLLALRSPLSVLVFVASVFFVVNRIGREEQLLCDAFPQSYPSYRQTSWRLLPYLY